MRLLITLLLCCVLGNSYAQDTTKVWKYAVTWKPLGIINPVLPNLTAGLLYKCNDNLLLEFQAGFIYKANIFDYSATQKLNIKGFKSNLEFKLFFHRGFYGGSQFMFQRYTRETNEYYLRYAMTYQELFSIEKLVNTYVGHLKLGIIEPIINNKFIIDVYGAIGLRYKTVALQSYLPEDASVVERRGVSFGTNDIGNQLYPSLVAGFSLGYIIR